VVVGLAVCQVAIFLTTIFLHRTLSHRAITMSPGLRFACRFVTWMTTGIRPRQWVAVHRKHHAFTDVTGDPHSPVLQGFWRVQIANVVLYRRAAKERQTVEKYARDMPPDRWDRVLFDHALLGLGFGIALLYLTLGGNWRPGSTQSRIWPSTPRSMRSATPSGAGPSPGWPPTASGWPG
jgi:stearoyl-CoA desaturase (delta-9 desaturase)